MSMGVHHPYHLDLCANDEDPSQLIIRPGWDAPHVRCSPRTFCAWPCLLRQVGTVLGSPYDCVVVRLAYANPVSRHEQHDLCDSYILDVVHDTTENYFDRGKFGYGNFHITKTPLFMLKVLK